ncbi:hypothetical protein IWZ03DRAFT_44498 [Phyllosticta citriasiana]|uniref:Uncharacterized protein n=1 Tax=Phyllosticta citriasiana TaxID=595635 RepID=A0ABR1KE73_9PEZI
MMTNAMTNFCIFPLDCSSAYLEKVRVEPMSCVFCFEAGQTHHVLAELCKGPMTPRVLACRHLPHLVLLPCCFWDFHSVSGPSSTFTFVSHDFQPQLQLILFSGWPSHSLFSFFSSSLPFLFFFFFLFFFSCAPSRRRNVFTMDSLQQRRAGGAATGTMDTERRRL